MSVQSTRRPLCCPTWECALRRARSRETAFMDVMGNIVLDRLEEARMELAGNRAALDRITKQADTSVGRFLAGSVSTAYGAWSGLSEKSVEITAGIPMFVGAVVSGDIGVRELLGGAVAMGVHAYKGLGHAWDAAGAGRWSEASHLATGSATDFVFLGEGAAGVARMVKGGVALAGRSMAGIRTVAEGAADAVRNNNMSGGMGMALAEGAMLADGTATTARVASGGVPDLLPTVAMMGNTRDPNLAGPKGYIGDRLAEVKKFSDAVVRTEGGVQFFFDRVRLSLEDLMRKMNGDLYDLAPSKRVGQIWLDGFDRTAEFIDRLPDGIINKNMRDVAKLMKQDTIEKPQIRLLWTWGKDPMPTPERLPRENVLYDLEQLEGRSTVFRFVLDAQRVPRVLTETDTASLGARDFFSAAEERRVLRILSGTRPFFLGVTDVLSGAIRLVRGRYVCDITQVNPTLPRGPWYSVSYFRSALSYLYGPDHGLEVRVDKFEARMR